MNRIIIAVLLGLVAVAAGGVWALGQFGGSATPVVIEAREPIVREPEIVAAVEPEKVVPAQAPATAPKPAKPKVTIAPAKPASTPAPAARQEPAPAPAPAEPAATPPPAPTAKEKAEQAAKDALRSALGKASVPTSVPATPSTVAPSTLAPSSTTTTPPPAPLAPAAEPAAPAAVPEPTVSVQTAPAPKTAKPAAAAREQVVTPASVAESTVTQPGAPAGLEAQFKSRRVTYNRPPEKLVINRPVDVSLVVNATQDAEAGKVALEGFKGEIVERDVDLSDIISAQLTGVGFDITTQTQERQKLSGKIVNQWQWRVTPTEPGEHTMILRIFGYASGSLDAEPLDAYQDRIVVEVEQIDQLVTWAKGVQPLFAVLAAMAAMGSAIFAFLRLREEKKQTRAGQRAD